MRSIFPLCCGMPLIPCNILFITDESSLTARLLIREAEKSSSKIKDCVGSICGLFEGGGRAGFLYMVDTDILELPFR